MPHKRSYVNSRILAKGALNFLSSFESLCPPSSDLLHRRCNSIAFLDKSSGRRPYGHDFSASLRRLCQAPGLPLVNSASVDQKEQGSTPRPATELPAVPDVAALLCKVCARFGSSRFGFRVSGFGFRDSGFGTEGAHSYALRSLV